MKKILSAGLLMVLATPAFAHHPLAGQPMETFTHGLLSGIGHPLLGFDHLFFVIVAGIAAAYTAFPLRAPLAYIIAMVAGCLMMSFGTGLPLKEAVIALSLLVVGGVVLSGRALGLAAALLLFAGFGLFHGSAFGDTIADQEAGVGGAVLVGYLIGLAVLQYGIAVAAGYFVKRVLKASDALAVEARLAGAVVAGIGLFLTLENLEGVLLGALGLGA